MIDNRPITYDFLKENMVNYAALLELISSQAGEELIIDSHFEGRISNLQWLYIQVVYISFHEKFHNLKDDEKRREEALLYASDVLRMHDEKKNFFLIQEKEKINKKLINLYNHERDIYFLPELRNPESVNAITYYEKRLRDCVSTRIRRIDASLLDEDADSGWLYSCLFKELVKKRDRYQNYLTKDGYILKVSCNVKDIMNVIVRSHLSINGDLNQFHFQLKALSKVNSKELDNLRKISKQYSITQ